MSQPAFHRYFLLRSCLFVGYVALIGGCSCESTTPQPAGSATQVHDPALLPMKYRDHNVVLISFDALQAAHVGCLGNSRDVTPYLDAFAAESFLFEHDYSVASWTVPSSMTWFTGIYPSEHGLTNKFAVYSATEKRPAKLAELAPHVLTLAQVLQQAGYQTGGFTGNAGVSGDFGFSQGFDTYYHEPRKFGGFDQSIPKALAWLKEHQNQKFFLFLHGYDCHGQLSPVGGYDYRFVDRRYDGKYRGTQQEQELLREEGLERGRLEMRDADVQFWRAVYDEKIQRADEKLGRFLHEVKQRGLLEKTLFIITSDHGTEFYEHQRFDHGFSLYDEQLRVPLVIKLPGQKSGKRIAERVSSISLMPTILDLLDIPFDYPEAQRLRGTSLSSTLTGNHAPQDVFSETNYREYTYKRSILSPEGWKLIVTLENNQRELFDLKFDPGELTNLAKQEPARADELQQRLFAQFQAIGHDLTAVRWQTGLNPVYESQGK